MKAKPRAKPKAKAEPKVRPKKRRRQDRGPSLPERPGVGFEAGYPDYRRNINEGM